MTQHVVVAGGTGEVGRQLLEASLALEPGQRRILEGLDLHPGPVAQWGRP